MSAAAIAQALGGHRAGRDWMARCPAHDDRTPSLAIRLGRDGKVLLKCHAGCAQWDIIGALKDRGIWTPGSRGADARPAAPSAELRSDSGAERTAFALRLWNESVEAQGTLVSTYLRSRGLVIPTPASLRFHPGLKHPSGSTWPAMVSLITSGIDGEAIGIHRTFLARDGSGKAPVSPAKMMLGPTRGGAVRLAPAAATLMVGEGIETTLSAMQATGLPGWAALSTSGLKSLILPDAVGEVIILADADPAGEAAARAASLRWQGEGRRVRVARPRPGCKDFNDMLYSSPELAGGRSA